MEKGEFERVDEYLTEAIDIQKSTGNVHYLGNSLELAKIKMTRGKDDEALSVT